MERKVRDSSKMLKHLHRAWADSRSHSMSCGICGTGETPQEHSDEEIEKRKCLVKSRQALEGWRMKSFFDFNRRTEATRGARRWSWPGSPPAPRKASNLERKSTIPNTCYIATKFAKTTLLRMVRSKVVLICSQQ